jgi:MerR family transcriptional regulator, light-induced transcriptional regulator
VKELPAHNEVIMSILPAPEIETGNDEPLYNIGVVARMTGISMATLRAWERRYDFPSAKRTIGGHRLFSERDILQLRWVRERIEEGMQTAQSIHALRHQEQTGHLVYTQSDSLPDRTNEHEGLKPGEKRSYLETQQNRVFEALIQHDSGRADEILSDTLAIATPEDVILGMVAPVLNRIGEGWEAGAISIGTEHFGTSYLRQRLLMWMLSGPPALKAPPIVLACAPGEWHEGSLLIMGALLRRRRWPVAYLGQSLPLTDLATIVKDIKPSIVVLVAMTESSAMEMAQWPEWMPDLVENGKPVVAYGGRIFVEEPVWRAKMPGIYLGSNFEDGLNTLERLARMG